MKFKDWPKLPLVIIAAMFVVGAFVYPSLPERIPTHWGPSGAIDRWADRSFWSVFFAPLMGLGVYLLLMLAPYFDPKRANLLRSRKVYELVLDLVTGLMAVVFIGTLLAADNPSFPMDRLITAGVSIMFIVLGNYMGRVQRNWTLGVRYGWTLSDDVVWKKTNRLAGRMFVVAGVLGLIGMLLPPMWTLAMLIVPILTMLPVTYVYSWRLYRSRHPEDVAEPVDRDAGAASE